MTREKFIFIAISVCCSSCWKSHFRKPSRVRRAPHQERGRSRERVLGSKQRAQATINLASQHFLQLVEALMKTGKRLALGVAAFLPVIMVQADNGGISFWLPGQFGALAAVPTEPGWSMPLIYYHANAKDDT